MSKLLCIIWFLLMSVTILKAERVNGIVVDEFGEPMVAVAVFPKNNPSSGVSTDAEGRFELNVDATDGEVLIVSMITYKTVEYNLEKYKPGTLLRFTMQEQPIMLDEVAVNAKLSRKEAKKMKKEVLTKFQQRLKKDFPKVTNKHEIVSSYSGKQNGRELMNHEIIGVMTEYPAHRKGGGDSLKLTVAEVRQLVTDEVKEGYVLLDEMANQKLNSKKAKKKGLHYTKTKLDDQALKMHRFLWGGEACFIAERIDLDKLSRWQYTVIGDQTVLIYTEKTNVLVAKAVVTIYFYIDPATCALKKMTQCFEGELHIPFGYKLSGEELEFLNALQLPNETLDKYRVRHVYGTVKRNVIFNSVSAEQRKVKEKNLQVDTKIVGSKKETFKYDAKAKVIITK